MNMDEQPNDMGDFGKVGPLDLSSLSPGEVQAKLNWDEDAQQKWQLALGQIAMGIQGNNQTKAQVATILSIVGNTAKSLGMVLTLA